MTTSLDLIRAYLTISKPRYPKWRNVQTIQPIVIDCNPETSVDKFDTRFGHTYDVWEHELCCDGLSLIHSLEDLSMLMTTSALGRDLSEPARDHTKIMNAVKETLHRLPGILINKKLKPAMTCFRLAALIFLDIAIHEHFGLGKASRISHHRSLFTQLDPYSQWGCFLDIVLRLLIKGDRAALEETRRAWYMAEILILSTTIGTVRWTEIEEMLCDYLVQPRDGNMEMSLGWSWDLKATAEMVIEDWT